MLFSGRAYYNLLLLERLRGGKLAAQGWESLDYRLISIAQVFSMLENQGVLFTPETFKDFSKELDSPEEVIEKLCLEEGDSKRKIYLLVFELFRRLLPEKEAVSIFCDELDRTIALYENQRDDTKLFESLVGVLEILDRNTTFTEAPKEIFARLCLYIAHDLENVIYTYIDSKIRNCEEDACIDLLDHFMAYVKDKRGLQFLKLKSLPLDLSEEIEKLTEYLVFSLQEDVNIPLSFPVLNFLISRRNTDQFKDLFAFLIGQVKEENTLVALLEVLSSYHNTLGHLELQNQVKGFLHKHYSSPKKFKISIAHKKAVLSLLNTRK